MMITHDDALRERMARHLAEHPLLEADHEGHKRAAVAIVVVPSEPGADPYDPGAFSAEEMQVVPGDISGLTGAMTDVAGGAAFLLCRRAAKLNSHGGQWALPGGRMDPGETPEETARRELHEELGLDLPTSAVLGRLDDYVTRSGYIMTPVVLWAGGDVVLRPDPSEVAHVYRIGCHHLQREDSPRFITIPESERPVVQVPLGGDLIHAPTGAVLVQFRWVALDGDIGRRVNEFEQPVFAWK